jgi:hypothetical protein
MADFLQRVGEHEVTISIIECDHDMLHGWSDLLAAAAQRFKPPLVVVAGWTCETCITAVIFLSVDRVSKALDEEIEVDRNVAAGASELGD